MQINHDLADSLEVLLFRLNAVFVTENLHVRVTSIGILNQVMLGQFFSAMNVTLKLLTDMIYLDIKRISINFYPYKLCYITLPHKDKTGQTNHFATQIDLGLKYET